MSVNYMDMIHCLTAWHTILKTTGKPWQLMVLNPTKLISDVPLGKRLGPLYFFIHINGLPSVVTSKVLLFASDCLLHGAIWSTADKGVLQQQLTAVGCSEMIDGGMWFNAGKCYVMHVSRLCVPISIVYANALYVSIMWPSAISILELPRHLNHPIPFI